VIVVVWHDDTQRGWVAENELLPASNVVVVAVIEDG
jgi:hypothetical protein